MTFILISGMPCVGKTYVCNKLHKIIETDTTFTVKNRKPSTCADNYDFTAHYKKDGKHIVVNSPSDSDMCMEHFAKYLDELAQDGVRPDIVITTIRESDYKEDQMSRMLALLEALANDMPNLEAHYKSVIMGKLVHTPFAPPTLRRNAFVLHLEKQDVDGVPNKNKRIMQYGDGKADKVKAMLDLALGLL